MKLISIVATMGVLAAGLQACEREPAVNPDMLRIAQAMAPCAHAVNAIPEQTRTHPDSRAQVTEAAAGVCAPASAAIRALSDPAGDAAAFEAAKTACAGEMDAMTASLVSQMNLNALEAAGTATDADSLATSEMTNPMLAERARCDAALGAPSYQLRRDAGLE